MGEGVGSVGGWVVRTCVSAAAGIVLVRSSNCIMHIRGDRNMRQSMITATLPTPCI